VALTPARVATWTRFAPLFALLAWAGYASPARADVTNLDGTNAPIVRVSLRQGDLRIRTWDRPSVEIDGDASLAIERRTTHQAGGDRSILIPEAEAKTRSQAATLPAESFVIAHMPPGERELISVRTTSNGNVGTVTITIPADSVFVFAHIAKGNLELRDFHGGTFVGFASHGRLSLDDDGGTVFAQTGIGPLLASDSGFEHLRARSLLGNLVFERCAVRQIEATAVDGSIVYDAGIFEAGLARFESTSGNVAVSSTGSANLGGRALGNGRVFTNFAGDTPVDTGDRQADAVVRGGGPVVTATSELGNVYLYDGSLRDHAQMPPAWNAPAATLARPGTSSIRRAGAGATPPRLQVWYATPQPLR
jgi:hypothetical protein